MSRTLVSGSLVWVNDLKTSGVVCGHCGGQLGWLYLLLETEQGGLQHGKGVLGRKKGMLLW